MKYLKYNALLVALLAFNVVLWGQSNPCTDLPVKPIKGEVINVPTLITPTNTDKANVLLDLILQCPDKNDGVHVILNDGENETIGNWAVFASTSCMPNDVTVTQTQGVPSGSIFTEGTYPMVYAASDQCGNTATCEFDVVVSHYKPIVAFVHGLNGDNSSWSMASSYTAANFKAYEVQIDYNPDDGLEQAGESLNDLLISTINNEMTSLHGYNTSTNTPKNRKANFIIAHSQGGIVAQYGEKYAREQGEWNNFGVYYGGLVTFGSSNRGAYVLNSLMEDDNGTVVFNDNDPTTKTRFQNFANCAAAELTAGKIEEIASEIFGLKGKVKEVLNGIVSLVSDKVPKILVDGNINATTKGYIVNPTVSQSVTKLTDFFDGNPTASPPIVPPSDPIPKVAFYGVVNDETPGQLLWRAAFWAQNGPNSFPTTNPAFGGATLGAGLDGQNDANALRDKYFEKQEHYTTLANWHVNHSFGGIFHKNKIDEYRGLSYAFRRGVTWIDVVGNRQYKALIGANVYQASNSTCYCNCVETDYDDDGNSGVIVGEFTTPLADCNADCNFGPFVDCDKIVPIDVMKKESDGLVLAESASYIAGATVHEGSDKVNGLGTYSKADFVMYGSIHMQMRNDKNMKEKLEGRFIPQPDGTSINDNKGLYQGYYGDHFKID